MGHGPTSERDKRAVEASRLRCEQQHNLLPDAARPILRLQSSEVAPRSQEMVELTGGRRGIFRQLAEIAASTGQCLVLTDADGVLVRLEGTEGGGSDLARYGIALGSCWNERIAGTNGVAMALEQGEAFTVSGVDHFYSSLHPFACTAAPLLDAENRTIGTVTLSSVDRGNRAEYLFARQLLVATADRIQRILFEQRFADAMIVRVSRADAASLLPHHELVAIDGSFEVIGSTAKAHDLVNLAGPSELLGKRFEDIFSADAALLSRVPERVLSTRPTTGAALDLSVRRPVRDADAVRGWRRASKTETPTRNFPDGVPPNRIRRRLPPSLRELSHGSKAMGVIIEQARAHYIWGLPFILEGESGTGKSALIAALHAESPHSGMRVMAIDCATLGEKEEDRSRFSAILEQARVFDAFGDGSSSGATLAFDNADEMPDCAQALLRGLLAEFEEGADAASPLRVVATSRRPLVEAVEQGRFRDDLSFLLGTARLALPPLRCREQHGMLAHALAKAFCFYVEAYPAAAR